MEQQCSTTPAFSVSKTTTIIGMGTTPQWLLDPIESVHRFTPYHESYIDPARAKDEGAAAANIADMFNAVNDRNWLQFIDAASALKNSPGFTPYFDTLACALETYFDRGPYPCGDVLRKLLKAHPDDMHLRHHLVTLGQIEGWGGEIDIAQEMLIREPLDEDVFLTCFNDIYWSFSGPVLGDITKEPVAMIANEYYPVDTWNSPRAWIFAIEILWLLTPKPTDRILTSVATMLQRFPADDRVMDLAIECFVRLDRLDDAIVLGRTLQQHNPDLFAKRLTSFVEMCDDHGCRISMNYLTITAMCMFCLEFGFKKEWARHAIEYVVVHLQHTANKTLNEGR